MTQDQPPAAAPMYVYTGTYTRDMSFVEGKAQGIYVLRMDTTGSLTYSYVVSGVNNPSFLAFDLKRRYLYSVGETNDGTVYSFAVDAMTGGLTFLNQQPSYGDAPCYVSVDHSGRWVFVANYTSGSISVYPIQPDGSLGVASDTIQHEGSSVNPQRQEGPHAHCILATPDNRYVVVADLGLDRLMVYRFDAEQGKLTPNDPPWTATRPGSGPRQIAFHPNGQYAYVINELDSTVDACRYDSANGTFEIIQSVPSVPSAVGARNSGAAIRVDPSGRYVYASNRGHNSIAMYSINPATGTLFSLGQESTVGQTPRDFGIDPAGTFLLAANQASDTVMTFRIDPTTGRLLPTGKVADVATPVCVIFRPIG